MKDLKDNRFFPLTDEHEKKMEYEKWVKEIPYMQFPNDWKVQITPPYRGAVVRFMVRKDDMEVSIYLDCYDKLGSYDSPYWEVYPHKGDCFRCDMSDTESLLNAITESLSGGGMTKKNNKKLETLKDMGRGMLEWQLEKNIQQVNKNLKDKKNLEERYVEIIIIGRFILTTALFILAFLIIIARHLKK